MTLPKHAVRVTIGGEDYTVRSELPPEYTKEVAACLRPRGSVVSNDRRSVRRGANAPR